MYVRPVLKPLSSVAACILAGIFIWLHVRLSSYGFDDAFIHFRVARNLLESGYPYYNVNEMLKVSTSSGWTVLLALLLGLVRMLKMEGYFPFILSILNAGVSVCGMLVFVAILQKLLKGIFTPALQIQFQVCFLALIIPSSIGLMETPLALLISGLGIYCLMKSKAQGFILLGLAVNIRLELWLALALVGAILLVYEKFRVAYLYYFSLGCVPFWIYDLIYFHTILPHSIVAKSVVYSVTWLETMASVLYYSYPVIPVQLSFILNSILFLGMLILTPLVAIGLRGTNGYCWHLIFYSWSLLIVVGYVAGHAQVFEWYIPLYTIPLLVAAFSCISSIEYPRQIFMKGIIFILFLTSFGFIGRTLYASSFDPGSFTGFTGGARVRSYLHIGAILYEEYPRAVLITSEIGGLGYTFKGKILDAAGLASQDALDYHPMQVPQERENGFIGAVPPEYVRAHLAELIVSYPYFLQAFMSSDMIQYYNLIKIPAFLPEDEAWSDNDTIGGSKHLYVYVRKDLPIPERLSALEQ